MRYFKYIVYLYLFSLSIGYAQEIIFKTKGFHYSLVSSTNQISLNGYMIELNFIKKDCNRNLITTLHRQITKRLSHKVTAEKDYHIVTINNKEYKIEKSSPLGKYLYNFPKTAIKLKRKEAFLCRDK